MADDNTRGALFMMGSMTAFTLNDACMKSLSGELPLFQALFLRGCGTVLVLLLLTRAMGQLRLSLPRGDWGLIALRCLAEIASAYFFLTALYNMPLANVTAILQALPLTVTLAAALVFAEPLGWRRLSAIFIGFCGVLLIVRPGTEGFTVHSVYALAAVACVTVRDLAARRMSRSVPSMLIALSAAVTVTLAFGAAAAFGDWAPVSTRSVGLLGGAMVFVLFGYVFSVSAMRVGEIGVVASFRYVALLVALVTGFVVFGDWPTTATLAGAAIIVATGLFTLYRERRIVRPAPVGLRAR